MLFFLGAVDSESHPLRRSRAQLRLGADADAATPPPTTPPTPPLPKSAPPTLPALPPTLLRVSYSRHEMEDWILRSSSDELLHRHFNRPIDDDDDDVTSDDDDVTTAPPSVDEDDDDDDDSIAMPVLDVNPGQVAAPSSHFNPFPLDLFNFFLLQFSCFFFWVSPSSSLTLPTV